MPAYSEHQVMRTLVHASGGNLVTPLRRIKAPPEALQASAVAVVHFIRAKFRQKFCRLSMPPKSVVKLVESTSTISPVRC